MPASGVPESALLTRARAREIFDAAASAAQSLGVHDIEAMIGAGLIGDPSEDLLAAFVRQQIVTHRRRRS